MEAILQRLLVVVLVGRILYDDGIISFADFPPLLGLGFSLLRDLDFLRGACGSETNFFKSSYKTQDISATTHKDGYSTRGYGYLPPLAGARRSTLGQGTPCTVACP
jgi:hypothetical protein